METKKEQYMKTLTSKKRARGTAIGRCSASLLIAAGMQNLGLLPLHAATAAKEITDSGITSTVEKEFRLEKGVSPDSIDASTSEGIVTLSGSAANLLAKDRAVQIAESIRGVRGVIDRITVTPVSRPNADIRTDILTALKQDPATESYKVAVSVEDAAATLSGSVGSYAEQQLVARIAKGVKGVKEVRNSVTINYAAKRTDQEIAADLKSRFQWDIWINGGQINPVVKDGNVTLSGTIGNAISKWRAHEDAWVNGVTSVDDSGLKVELASGSGAQRDSEGASSSDSEIKQAVQAALRLDPRVSAFSPDVTVENGGVILGGTVGNLKAKTSAEQDAKNIMGVWRVDNLLKVRPNGRPTDMDVEKQLKAALAWDPLLVSSTIDVAVINRTAYLSGGVESRLEKTEAQDVASRIKGVVMVRNHLKVEPDVSAYYYNSPDYSYYGWPDYSYYDWPYYGNYGWPYYTGSPYYDSAMYGPQPYLSDEQITKNIESKFFWSPFVDRDDVKVTVHGAVATLTGTVGTWIGYGEADRDAHKGGATSVLNEIKVKKGHWL